MWAASALVLVLVRVPVPVLVVLVAVGEIPNIGMDACENAQGLQAWGVNEGRWAVAATVV
jgi:hypothetical protein